MRKSNKFHGGTWPSIVTNRCTRPSSTLIKFTIPRRLTGILSNFIYNDFLCGCFILELTKGSKGLKQILSGIHLCICPYVYMFAIQKVQAAAIK